ncbi:MAG: hypothetical protein HOC23_15455 [Halieaceae bacterium]|jgi:hypothetical protein|nr:hypothetical protein [Halieaceae bacterium]
MIDLQQTYHTGVLVPCIEAATRELPIAWCEVQDFVIPVWTSEHRQLTELRLKYTYAKEGPHRIELIEGEPGSFWDGAAHPGVHHIGVWADDVGVQTQQCVEAGWVVELAGQSPEDGYGVFSYLRSPAGFRVELVEAGSETIF